MRTVLCTGSRGWQDEETIYDALDSILRPFRIIVGDAKSGADPIFWACATVLEVPRLKFKAKWKLYHNGAGHRRNEVMLTALRRIRSAGEENTLVMAAWDGQSSGTKGMIDIAESAKFNVWRLFYAQSS